MMMLGVISGENGVHDSDGCDDHSSSSDYDNNDNIDSNDDYGTRNIFPRKNIRLLLLIKHIICRYDNRNINHDTIQAMIMMMTYEEIDKDEIFLE